MGVLLQDLVDRRVGLGLVPFDESEFPANFPFARWNLQSQRYVRYWRHWTGEVWDETFENRKDENGKPVLKYPLQINFLATIAKKHAAALIGEVSDTISPAIPIRVRPKPSLEDEEPDKTQARQAKQLTQFVNDVWDENAGKVLQSEGALISQFLGGIVYQVKWQPDDPELENQIRIELVLPDFFMPVWDTGRPDNLLEAYVVWRIPAREAELRFGWKNDGETTFGPLYVEHWTKDTIRITVGNVPVQYTYNGVTIVYDAVENPFGQVPFIYIPRKRAGTYYGLSMVEDIEGKAIELNARLADMGDMIQDTAQRDAVAKNLGNTPVKTIDLGKGRIAINLGTAGPNQPEPSLEYMDPPAMPDALKIYPELLLKQLYHDSGVPPVAFGEDQGSQRSGATLQIRFWALTSEIRQQRIHWDYAMVKIAKLICRIAILKGIGGITEEHLKGKQWRNSWSPSIPRDREQTLNEGMLLLSEQGLHPATLNEKLDASDDPWGEYKKAQAHYEWKMETEAEAQAKAKPDDSIQVQKPKAVGGSTP